MKTSRTLFTLVVLTFVGMVGNLCWSGLRLPEISGLQSQSRKHGQHQGALGLLSSLGG